MLPFATNAEFIDRRHAQVLSHLPVKVPSSCGGSGAHPMYGFVRPASSCTLQTASRSVHPFTQGSGPTDRPPRCRCSNSPHHTATRPNNDAILRSMSRCASSPRTSLKLRAKTSHPRSRCGNHTVTRCSRPMTTVGSVRVILPLIRGQCACVNGVKPSTKTHFWPRVLPSREITLASCRPQSRPKLWS